MKNILLAAALLVGLNSFAQKDKEKKPKDDEKYVYTDATLETDDYKVYIIDAVAVGGQAKFKIKIFNKTNDYLLVKPSEFTYVAGDKKITSRDKTFAVPPNDEEIEVIDFKGSEMQAESFTVEMAGIYKASAGGKVCDAPNFEIPPSKNEFTAGNFSCTLKKADATTARAVGKFECVYTGDGVGLINPNKAVLVMPNGSDNPNAKKHKSIILEKAKNDDFTVVFNEVKDAGDMQKKQVAIKWMETFRESKLLKLNPSKIVLTKDAAKK
jgi:hypothetical protein